MRLAETGPWWDHTLRPALHRTPQEDAELTDHETFLADRDDRARLQALARTQLTAEHQPIDRLTVARRARRLAHPTTGTAANSPSAHRRAS